MTLNVNAKLQFSNFAFPKSTNLGELVVVANMFGTLFHFYCCALSAVLVLSPMLSKQLVPPKFQNIVFVVVAFVVHSTLLHFPRFYGQTLALYDGQELLLYLTMSLKSLLYNGLYELGLGLLLLIFLSSCFLNCSRRAALCQTRFHR